MKDFSLFQKTETAPHRIGMMQTTLIAFALTTATHSVAIAASTNLVRTVDGMTIYIGLVPGEIIGTHPPTHPESKMHGGKPIKRNSYHLVATLYEEKTGTRIADAQVQAGVTPLGLGPEKKKLEPMTINNTISYGNYFSLPLTGPYGITLYIQRPGSSHVSEARFNYKR